MMTNQPLVSVCIPTYNAAEFFEPCLQSAIAQTHPNIEILISDDGSTDNTVTIAEKYAAQYSQIRIVRNAEKGMVNNWNYCIDQAKGDWIKFLFQDDILTAACVEKLLAACLENNIDVGLCRRKFIIHNNVAKRITNAFRYKIIVPERVFEDLVLISPERLAKDMADLLPENILGEPTCYFFNKRIIEQTGKFDTDFKQVVDMEFILRLALLRGMVFLAEPLAMFRVHGKSESSANLRQDKEAQMRHIAAVVGDTILLFHKILYNAAFKTVREVMTEDVLRMRINHLYQSGCKHKGTKIFNKALGPIRKKYDELGQMKYSFFKYIHYRKRYKKWERESQ